MRTESLRPDDRMAYQLVLVGVNHKVAPVELRERLAFNPENLPQILQTLAKGARLALLSTGEKLTSPVDRESPVIEAVLLSTCNRSELYLCANCSHPSPPGEESPPSDALTSFRPSPQIGCKLQAFALKFLAARAGLSQRSLRKISYLHTGRAAARHLLHVAAGLDSLVLGENEILGQVRVAAELAQKAGTCGSNLSALFRFAVQAGKRVRNETEIGRASLSVAGVVVELAEQILGDLHNRTALLIGAGKISTLTGRALVSAGLRCVLVANRTFERAQKLASSLNCSFQSEMISGAQAVHFDALAGYLPNADIVICSTGAPHIVLHLEAISQALEKRRGHPLLIADLAVPRDVDPAIATLPGVTLVNIDDLKELVETRHPLALSVQRAATTIVSQILDEFCDWYEARRFAPLIQALQDKAQVIIQAEIQRTLPRLGELNPRQQAALEAMAQSIANRLLHDPIMHLKDPGSALISADSALTDRTAALQEFSAWFADLFDLQVGLKT